MKALIKFLKGIALGIANIVPGFSGGTMAIMLNIYDDFVTKSESRRVSVKQRTL